MRLLFLSNYFPPIGNGGYEQLCQEVAVELADRGNQVCVLTSRRQGREWNRQEDGVSVRHQLRPEVDAGLVATTARRLIQGRRLVEDDVDRLRRLIGEFQPNAALIWGMWNISRAIPAAVESLLPGRVAYYLCDYWPSLPSSYLQQWHAPAKRPLAGLVKQALGRQLGTQLATEPEVPLELTHPICVSPAVRDLLVRAGVRVERARIINNGIRIGEFPFRPRVASRNEPAGLRLLYAGRVSPEKGVHTAIRAVGRLSGLAHDPVTLDIVGSGDARYERELLTLVQQLGLADRVSFRGRVARTDMPNLLAGYDVLVFPSEWEEPLARIVLEAMATGLVVVGTTTGGMGEALEDGKTGLTFPPKDVDALVAQLQRVRDQPALRRRLVEAARQRVTTRFTFIRMVNQIEDVLQDLATGRDG